MEKTHIEIDQETRKLLEEVRQRQEAIVEFEKQVYNEPDALPKFSSDNGDLLKAALKIVIQEQKGYKDQVLYNFNKSKFVEHVQEWITSYKECGLDRDSEWIEKTYTPQIVCEIDF